MIPSLQYQSIRSMSRSGRNWHFSAVTVAQIRSLEVPVIWSFHRLPSQGMFGWNALLKVGSDFCFPDPLMFCVSGISESKWFFPSGWRKGAGTKNTQQTKIQLKSFKPLTSSHVKKTILQMLLKMLFSCQFWQELAAYVQAVYKIRKNKKSYLIA